MQGVERAAARAAREVVLARRLGSPGERVVARDGRRRLGRLVTAGDRDDGTDYPGWEAIAIPLTPGEHQYAIVEDGAWLLDPNVPTSGYYGDQEVSWLDMPDCSVPGLSVTSATASSDGSATVSAQFLTSAARDPLDLPTLVVTERDGTVVTPASVEADALKGALALTFTGLAASGGKHALLVDAKDTHGRVAEEARATVWIEPRPFDWHDAVIYQVIVDRYRGPGGAPLMEPALLSGRAGGHVDGVRAAIESGELASLGVNTLWISPLYVNPEGTFPGVDGRPYSSYHGYWPIDAARPRARDRADRCVGRRARSPRPTRHGMRVLFDVVPNHVHQQHPYVAQHMTDGWFVDADGSCICGIGTCDWATHIEDCWFAPYLPSLDWELQAVTDQCSADVAWWLEQFDADGIRIDAVPMMPRAANRRIAWELRQRFDHPGNKTFLLGENYTGPDGYGLIRYDLGPFGLDSEFHFPLLWALRERKVIFDETAPMSDVDDAVERGEADWAGSGAVKSTMIGSHERATVSNEQSTRDEGHRRLDPRRPAAGHERRLREAGPRPRRGAHPPGRTGDLLRRRGRPRRPRRPRHAPRHAGRERPEPRADRDARVGARPRPGACVLSRASPRDLSPSVRRRRAPRVRARARRRGPG